jgi:Tol biopolymer transport system component
VAASWLGLLCAAILLGSAGAAAAAPAAYLRSSAGPPFGASANETAMDRVFGAGNWDDLRFESVDAASLFSTQLPLQSRFVFMEGGDSAAQTLEGFLATHLPLIEGWVSAGGRLFLNAAPDQGDGMSFGFGGVTLVYPSLSGTGVAFDPFHPIFAGPFTPVAAAYSGGLFAHAELTGGGTTTIMTGDQARVVLAEMSVGPGLVLFGSMTPDSVHSPQPDAANLRANIIAYALGYAAPQVSSNETQTLTGGGPGGSSWFINNLGGTDNGLPTGGFCASTPGLTVFDASLGNQGDAFDNGLTLWVNDTVFVAPPIVDLAGQTYTAGPVAMAGLNVTMQYYAASQSGTLRTVARFDNPSGSPIPVIVKWLTNVGSDGATQVVGSSSGDAAFTAADRWVVTRDGGPFDPVNTHVLFGPGNPPVTPLSVSQVVFNCADTQGIFAQYSLQVPAGGTQALLFFNQLNPGQDQALAGAAAFDSSNLDGDLLAGLGLAERAQVQNWQLATAPDLVVDSIVLAPPSPTVGEPVTVTVTVRNQGGAAAGFFFVDFYQHRDTAPVGEIGDVACTFDSLGAGASAQCVQSVSYGSTGTFQAWAQVDVDQIVAESDEANNIRGPQNVVVQSQIPAGPDLLIDGVTVFPAAPVTGQPVTVTVTARNRGASAAGVFFIDIYPDRAAPPGPGEFGQASCFVEGGLAAGATTQCSQDVTYAQAGSFQLWAQVDSDQLIDETPNENNNVAGPIPVLVEAVPPGPDVVVDSIVLDPPVPVAGQQVTVTATARNRGGLDANGFFIDFYQDLPGPPQLGQVGSAYCFIPALAAGATTPCVRPVLYPTPGTFQAWAQVDTDGILAESHEDNNVFGPQTVRVQALLSVSKAGNGAGTVTSTVNGQPAAINCGNACQAAFDAGTVVTLSANPAQNSVFSGWTGACSGTGACQVTMSENLAVTANFALAGGAQQFTLTVQKSGAGTGTVTGTGINCGPDCAEILASGAQVALSASAAAGSVFTGWSLGGCPGTGQCQFSLGANTTVTATFAQQVTLTVSKAGAGDGTVTATVGGQPGGIACGADCAEPYASGTQVTLAAAAAPGSSFTGWSGGGCSGTGQCLLTISANVTVTAGFGGTAIRPMAYVRSVAGSPWGTSENESAMNAAFGADGWDDLRYETVSPAALFAPGRRFVFMEGSDQNAEELEGFLAQNRQAIEAWVSAGGRLFINAAPNEGDGMDFVFGVTLVYPLYAGQVQADPAALDHPIFQGPLTPAGTQFTGTSFAHAHVLGGGTTPLIREGTDGPIVLAQRTVDGRGLLLVGGMTTPNFHGPQPNATNLRANILTHAAFANVGARPFVYLRSAEGPPWGVATNEAAMNAVFGGGNWDDLRYESADAASLFSTQLPLGRQFIFMEGGFSTAPELEAFLTANLPLIQSWVSAGGRLFLNAAPNEGDGMSFGFGGVTLNFDPNAFLTASDTGTAVDPSHPIFQGPLTPAGTQFSGGFFTHAHVTGGGVTPLIADGLGRTALGQLASGAGLVLFGGMTTDNFHSPQPQAANLRANILAYTATATLGAATLSVTREGNGTGTVTSQPGGIDCGLDCVETYDGGTAVRLTAVAAQDSVFNGWSGPCAGTGPCDLILTGNTAVVASFTRVNNPQFLLTVARTGSGTGTVASQPAGIACGGDCTELYDGGTSVTLTASPSPGAAFSEWSGDPGCAANTAQVVVLMDGNKTCTAAFTQQVTLTVQKAGQGSGTVTSNVGGIDCGNTCAAGFMPGAAVTLSAAAAPGSQFEGWAGGACAGADPCIVAITQSTTVTATFRRLFTLTVALDGGGLGSSVISFPLGGIACPGDCQQVFVEATQVALIPIIPSGSAFLGFSANCTNGLVTVSQNIQCTATFVELGAEPASLGLGGESANGSSENPALSASGQFLAFDSDASNLDAGGHCTAGIVRNVFVLDLATGVITCVSLGPGNVPGNLDSTRPSISADGRFVAFESRANNLVGPTGPCVQGGLQVYVHDRATGTTTCVSVAAGGVQGNADSDRPAISANGRFVAFQTLAELVAGCGGTRQIAVRDLVTGQTSCVSVGPGGAAGNGASSNPSISQDGTVIAIESNATNLVAAGCNQPGQPSQIFVRDRSVQPAVTLCISVSASGTPGNAASVTPSISADGRVLAFASLATNLVPVGDPEQPQGCANGVQHVYRHDRDEGAAGDTDCVTVTPNGNPGDASSFEPVISGSGTVIVFRSAAGNLLGSPTPVNAAAGVLAAGGLVDQIIRSDAVRQAMEQMSQAGGSTGNGPSRSPTTNFGGDVVAFQSAASNLRPREEDTNGEDDVFVVRPPVPPPPATFPLRVALAGGGTVTSVEPAGISCPPDCEEPYSQGTTVRLRATADPGSIFVGWSGVACPGTGDCLVTVAGPGPTDVTATFQPAAGVVLTVRLQGEGGLVTSVPAGIACPPTCSAAFPAGTAVTLSATVTLPGGAFGGWQGGNCTGTGPCLVTLTVPVEVASRFAPPGRVILTSPPDGTAFPGGPARLVLTWFPPIPAATLYAVEHTAPNLVFHNDNGAGPDPESGFGGLGGVLAITPETTLAFDFNASAIPPGLYQLRVLPLLPGPSLLPGATFSDALTLRIGPPGSEQPQLTSPPSGFVAIRDVTPVLLAWTPVASATDYLLEVSAVNQPFTNPEGSAPDAQSGAGGGGFRFLVGATSLGPVTVPGAFAPGAYQIRVFPRARTGEFIGRAGPAITLEVR